MGRFWWEEPEAEPSIITCERCNGDGICEDPRYEDWIYMWCPDCRGDGYFDTRCGCPSEHHAPYCAFFGEGEYDKPRKAGGRR